MAKQEKEFQSLEQEMEVLADKRVKDLQGLGRKDRTKKDEITIQFGVDVEQLKKKWTKKKAKDDEKTAITTKERQIADEKTADKKAKDKQK